MPRTRNAWKAGTTDAVATVHWRIPLVDPDAIGNTGLQGYDEDSSVRVCADAAAARVAAVELARTASDGAEVDDLLVVERRWDGTDFNDPMFGHVYDALPIDTSEQYGYLDERGDVMWEQ